MDGQVLYLISVFCFNLLAAQLTFERSAILHSHNSNDMLIRIMAQIHRKRHFKIKPNQAAVHFVLQVGNNHTRLDYILVNIARPVAVRVSQYISGGSRS